MLLHIKNHSIVKSEQSIDDKKKIELTQYHAYTQRKNDHAKMKRSREFLANRNINEPVGNKFTLLTIYFSHFNSNLIISLTLSFLLLESIKQF